MTPKIYEGMPVKFLNIGLPGSGKSSIASTWGEAGRMMVFSFDGNASVYDNGQNEIMDFFDLDGTGEEHERFKAELRKLCNVKHDFKTVVIDPLSMWQASVIRWGKVNPRTAKGDQNYRYYMQAGAILAPELSAILNSLTIMHTKLKMNILVIDHCRLDLTEVETDDDIKKLQSITYGQLLPSTMGKMGMILPAYFSMVGHSEVEVIPGGSIYSTWFAPHKTMMMSKCSYGEFGHPLFQNQNGTQKDRIVNFNYGVFKDAVANYTKQKGGQG